jgi:hypothetical protein
MKKILKDKKGAFESALVDFYAAVAIILIVFIFFFFLHFMSGEMKFSLAEQEASYALDSTRLALIYLQSDVETSRGPMSIGEFIAEVAEDTSLRTELDAHTKDYFSFTKEVDEGKHVKLFVTPYGVGGDTDDVGLTLRIDTIIDGQKINLVTYEKSGKNYKQGTGSITTVLVPLHDGTTAEVELETEIVSKK